MNGGRRAMQSPSDGRGSFPQPLSPEEEAIYIAEMKDGSDDAKRVLIERNLRLVPHIARRFNFIDKEELNSVGQIGLIKAISSYDPDKGTRLATYASKCIANEMLMYLRSQKKYNNEVSMQRPVGVDHDGNQITIEDKLAEEDYDIDEQIALKIQVKQLYEKINQVLKDREKAIIQMRYGLMGAEETTQREIADKLNISRSYVSRIEKKAVKKLRGEMENDDGRSNNS